MEETGNRGIERYEKKQVDVVGWITGTCRLRAEKLKGIL